MVMCLVCSQEMLNGISCVEDPILIRSDPTSPYVGRARGGTALQAPVAPVRTAAVPSAASTTAAAIWKYARFAITKPSFAVAKIPTSTAW
jgi:hypothetical protein